MPANQGRGIGSRLMESVLLNMKQQQAAGCVLLDNPSFYARLGFVAIHDLVLPDSPPQYFQALAFGGFYAKGTVTYHQAFTATV